MRKTTWRAPDLAAAALVLLTLALPCAGADWPRFRGPGGASTSAEKNLPRTWSAASGIAWRTAMPGFGASSPIVAGDRVLLTCYSGYGLDARAPGKQEDLRLHLVCVDLGSGAVRWDRKVPARLPEQKYQRFLPEHGYASHTPVSDGEMVWAFFGKTGLFAYTLEGKRLWHADAGAETHVFGSANSPVLFEDLVIVNASVESDALIAFDKRTGKERWRAVGMKRSWCTPAIGRAPGGRPEVLVSTDGALLAFDPRSGKRLWSCPGIDDYVCPDAVIHDGIAYVTGGRRPPTIFAVKLGGSGELEAGARLWVTDVGSKIATPVYHEGRLYWVDHKGIAVCVDAGSGERLERKRLKGAGKTYASPVIAGGKIYVFTCRNGAWVLEAAPSMKVLAHNIIEDDTSVFNGTPAIVPGGLVTRSDRFLYRIGALPEGTGGAGKGADGEEAGGD